MSRSIITTFGAWVQARRKSLQLSQTQLAGLISYSTIAVCKLEAGDRQCSEELAVLLAKALEVPAQQFAAFMSSARTGLVAPELHSLELDRAPETVDASTDSRFSSHGLTQFADPATPLFGREDEIAQVLEMLWQPYTRLITLLGPPGVGKSRLGMALLEHVDSGDWPDGQFFVPLATINHSALIPQAIAAVISLQEINVRKWRDTVAGQSVFRFIKDKQALLVLDNFEHLSDGVAFISELLIAAPLVKVIVTSQVRLKVSNEQVYGMNPLAVPERTALTPLAEIAQTPAVSLFVARAKSRRNSFKLTESNASTVVELCRRLDGLPLALELAAVRLKRQTPQELLAQFSAMPLPSQSPAERSMALQWLGKGVTDMPKRHQTLFAALTWSYDLLTPEAHLMFEQLGVCRGSFTRAAALEMTQGSLASLELLAGQSLIQVQVTSDDRIRLSMLETFREFALMKLEMRGAAEDAGRRHATYFAEHFKGLDAGLQGLAHQKFLALMEADTPNTRAALQWCMDDDPVTGFVLARNLIYYWFIAGHHHEGRAWVLQLLAAGANHSAVSPQSRAKLVCQAVLLSPDTPVDVLEDHLVLFQKLGDAKGIALAKIMLGRVLMSNKPFEAEQYLAKAVDESDALGETWLSTLSRVFLASCMHARADYAASEKVLNQTIQLLTRLQDTRSLARIQNHVGWLAFVRGDFAKARVVESLALSLNQQFKDIYGTLEALSTLAFATIELGDLTAAKVYLDEGLRLAREAGVDEYQTSLLHAGGAAAFAQGNIKDACQLYLQSMAFAQQQSQTDHIRTTMVDIAQISIADAGADAASIVEWLTAVQGESRRAGYHFPVSYQKRMDATLAIASARLGHTAMASTIARGNAIAWDAAILLAQSAAEVIVIGSPSKSMA